MSTLTPDLVKQAMLQAGLEIYRTSGLEIRVAERIRMHLMDSGVAVHLEAEPQIRLTIRSQRSDFPSEAPEDLFERVRRSVRDHVASRGFHESSAVTRDITDPVDSSEVLDVWHELTFVKQTLVLESLIDDVVWALGVPKCVDH